MEVVAIDHKDCRYARPSLKILLLSRYDRLGSSSRIRTLQYIPFLEASGVTVTVSPLLGNDHLERLYSGKSTRPVEIIKAYISRIVELCKLRGFDLVWLEKELLPFSPPWVEALLELTGIPVVVDYDDATFHSYDRHPRFLVRVLLGTKIDSVMRHAALAVVGNDYLAVRARQAGAKRVEYLPSVVDMNRYLQAPKKDSGVFTIGWIGSPSTAQYLRLVEGALAEVCKEGKARLVLVGSGALEFKDLPVAIHPWSEVTEISAIHSFDVGIMPLADDYWERGKCGFKLIQCMACGLPVVASPVGVNRQIVAHGETGFLAATSAEWVRALTALRDNRELSCRMGAAAREKVAGEYSLQVNAPRLLELLRSVVK